MPASDHPADPTERLIARANALHDLGRDEAAIAVFLQAQTSAPEDIQVLGGLASCFAALGDLAEARRHADLAVAANPEEEWGHRLRGMVLLRLGELDAALAAARECVRLAPDHAPAYPILILTLLAKAQQSGGRIGLDKLDDAEAVAHSAIALDPNADTAHELLSLVAQGRKDWPGAERHARAALELMPDSASALSLLGQALTHQKRLHEAADIFRQAARIAPTSQSAHHNFLADTLRVYPIASAALALPWLVLGGLVVWRLWRHGLLVGPLSALAWMVPILPLMLLGFLLSLRRFMVFKGLPPPWRPPPDARQRRRNTVMSCGAVAALSTLFLWLSMAVALAAGLLVLLPYSGSDRDVVDLGMEPKLICILAVALSGLCFAARYLAIRRLRTLSEDGKL
jgi:Flp pilus assembly protein TadD